MAPTRRSRRLAGQDDDPPRGASVGGYKSPMVPDNPGHGGGEVQCTMSAAELERIQAALIFGAESIGERLEATEEEAEAYGTEDDAETKDYLEAGRRHIKTLDWFSGKLGGD